MAFKGVGAKLQQRAVTSALILPRRWHYDKLHCVLSSDFRLILSSLLTLPQTARNICLVFAFCLLVFFFAVSTLRAGDMCYSCLVSQAGTVHGQLLALGSGAL